MIVTVSYECGEKTCAVSPGNFCNFIGTKYFGTQFVCMLYRDEDGKEEKLFSTNGWLMRCKQCLQQQEIT